MAAAVGVPPEGERRGRRPPEDVLELSAEPADAARPVVCREERSNERHGPGAEPAPPPPGPPAQEDYDSQRNGPAKVFLRCGPLLGGRPLAVTARRGYQQVAPVRKTWVAVYFPKAGVLRVVRDHRNTPVVGAWYATFPAEEARRSAQRWEFPYPPKPGRWLHRAEREFRVLSRHGLDQRIDTAEAMAAAIAAGESPRNEARTKIDGTFRVAEARKKLHWIYPS